MSYYYCYFKTRIKNLNFSDKNEQRLMSEWNMWKNKFGKVYASFEEEVSRYV